MNNNKNFSLKKFFTITCIIFTLFNNDKLVFADIKNEKSQIILLEDESEIYFNSNSDRDNNNIIQTSLIGLGLCTGGYLLYKKIKNPVLNNTNAEESKQNKQIIKISKSDNNISQQDTKELNLHKKYEKLMCDVTEILKKVNKDNKANNYSVLSTGLRSLICKNNMSSIERAFQCKELYDKQKRKVTCWDASLAFMFELYSKYGPSGDTIPFDDMKVGLMSYNIKGCRNLANHVFCYFIVNNILHLVDPLLGYYADICLELSNEDIKTKINEFYNIQKNSDVMPGLTSKIFRMFRKKNNKDQSPFGRDGVTVSANIFAEDNMKLSEAKWLPDILFFNYLLEHKKIPGDEYFIQNCDCKMFG